MQRRWRMGYSCNTFSEFSFSSRILWLFGMNINRQGMFNPFNVYVLNPVIWHCFNFGRVDVRVSRKRCTSVRARIVKEASPWFNCSPTPKIHKEVLSLLVLTSVCTRIPSSRTFDFSKSGDNLRWIFVEDIAFPGESRNGTFHDSLDSSEACGTWSFLRLDLLEFCVRWRM